MDFKPRNLAVRFELLSDVELVASLSGAVGSIDIAPQLAIFFQGGFGPAYLGGELTDWFAVSPDHPEFLSFGGL